VKNFFTVHSVTGSGFFRLGKHLHKQAPKINGEQAKTEATPSSRPVKQKEKNYE